MPFPLIAAIGAGSSLLGQGINAFTQASVNRREREWNEHMYDRQRQDALDDWNRLNAYNAPLAQMERFKSAGLNPNLIYGHGATAADASPVRGTDVKSWNPQAPRFDLGKAVTDYQDVSIQSATLDNMRLQADVLKKDSLYRDAQILATLKGAGLTGVRTDQTAWELSKSQGMYPYQLSAAKLNVDKMEAETSRVLASVRSLDAGTKATLAGIPLTKARIANVNADTQFKLSESARRDISVSQDVFRTTSRLLTDALVRTNLGLTANEIQSRIRSSSLQSDLNALELQRQRLGASRTDPWYVRRVEALIQEMEGLFR